MNPAFPKEYQRLGVETARTRYQSIEHNYNKIQSILTMAMKVEDEMYPRDRDGQYSLFTAEEIAALTIPEAVGDTISGPELKSIGTGITNKAGVLGKWEISHALRDLSQNHVDAARLLVLESLAADPEWKTKVAQGISISPPVRIEFYLEPLGKYVGLNEAKELVTSGGIELSAISEIKISDSGGGYDYEVFGYTYSEGKDEATLSKLREISRATGIDLPGGQFGEGQKVASAVIMKFNLDHCEEGRAPIDLTFRSKTWSARLEAKDVTIGKNQAVEANFKVNTNEPAMEGSETIIRNLSAEFIEAALRIDRTVRDLGEISPPRSAGSHGYVYEWAHADTPTLQVRGYTVMSTAKFAESNGVRGEFGRTSALAYNFRDLELNRDRTEFASPYRVKMAISELILESFDSEWIVNSLRVLRESQAEYKNSFNGSWWKVSGSSFMAEYEILQYCFDYSDINEVHAKRFREAFYTAFGANALLATSSPHDPSDATKRGIAKKANLVFLDAPSAAIFAKMGVTTDVDRFEFKSIAEFKLGLDVGFLDLGPWGMLRELLKNHLDGALDISTGRFGDVGINVELTNGNLIPIRGLPEVKQDDIRAIHFSDMGEGYEYEQLSQWRSSKRDDESARYALGMHGEGLKIGASTALKRGHEVTYSSRYNGTQAWRAEAVTYDVAIRGESYSNVGFNVYASDLEVGSRTMVILSEDPQARKELLDIFYSLGERIRHHRALGLAEKDPEPLFSSASNRSHVTEKSGGKVFIRGVWTKTGTDTLMSYDFMDVPLNRDRDLPRSEDLKKAVGALIAELTDIALIKEVITAAVDKREAGFYEFQNFGQFPAFEKNRELWAQAFRDLYGTNAVLAQGKGNDANEAVYMGYRPISVNLFIARSLSQCGIKSDSEVLQDEFLYVDKKDLTTAEQKVLSCIEKLDKEGLLFPRMNTRYRVFSSSKNSDNPDLWTVNGYATIDGTNEIGFRRAILIDPQKLLDVYIHEKCHQISRAKDGTREHFRAATEVVSKHLFLRPEKLARVFEIFAEAFSDEELAFLRPKRGVFGFLRDLLKLNRQEN